MKKYDLSKLTVEQYMQLQLIIETFKTDDNKIYSKVIEYLYGTLDVDKKVGDMTMIELVNIFSKEEPPLIQRFEFQGKEWGFIPNLDEIKTSEWIDLDNYIKDGKQLHRIAAILYRPVTKSHGKLYDIEKYEGTDKYSEILKGVNYKVILGALVFFYHLRLSLLHASHIYINKERLRLEMMKKPNS